MLIPATFQDIKSRAQNLIYRYVEESEVSEEEWAAIHQDMENYGTAVRTACFLMLEELSEHKSDETQHAVEMTCNLLASRIKDLTSLIIELRTIQNGGTPIEGLDS